MATVDKNFRIKHGLVVEGSTATVNGNSILTENNSDQYILNLVGGATLIKSVDTGTFTVDNDGYLTINSGVFDLSGAASQAETNANTYTDNSIGNTSGKTVVEYISDQGFATSSDVSTGLSGKQDTLTAGSNINISGSTISVTGLTTADVSENSSNKYFTNQRALDATASAYDAAGAASTAETNAKTYTDNLIGDNTIDGTSGNTVKARIESAVANVVGMAPDALNTLQELAQAFDNNPDTLTNLITTVGGKQDALTAGNGIEILSGTITAKYSSGNGLSFNGDGGLQIKRATVDTWYDPAGAAATAETNANSYTDTAIGNIDSAVTQINGAAISPNNVTINSVANQYATTITGINIADGASTVMGLSATDYRTVKALVKAKNGNHTQVSEILVTLDTSNNIAITEYAMVGTNGSLGDVSALYHVSGNIFITFTPVYDNTDVMCYATALI